MLTHAESIGLFDDLGVGMIPELKSPSVAMPYEGDYTQEDYAQQMIDEYRQAGVEPGHVRAQSFNLEDVRYWIENEPQFGKPEYDKPDYGKKDDAPKDKPEDK